MNLSKALDCSPHDLLIAKLSTYRLNDNALKYMYMYLKNRKQCVRVNNVCGDFKDIISGFRGVQSSDQCSLMRS